MIWLVAHDDHLQECFAAGMSSSEAAASISGHFRVYISRNAAIGRAHRKGWRSKLTAGDGPRKGNVSRPRPAPKPRARPAPKPQVFACEPITGLRVADVVPLNISIYELTDETCHWPLGDGPPFVYCGCPTFDDSPWCEPHAALATRAWVERRAA